MEMADRQQALDAALAQIDRAFGKDAAEARKADYVKVWTDRYTEERVLAYVRERVEGYLDDEDGSPFHDGFWYDLDDDLERGEHRVIPHPKNRMWPPFTPWEDMRLAVRRVLGWFQGPPTKT
jgi:hypothetical protein